MSMDGTDDTPSRSACDAHGSVESLLFDSLVHHLIEKGLLTKNDALSVVQTAAEIVRGRMQQNDGVNDAALAMLERSYLSFEALPDRYGRAGVDARNVHEIRIPLHGDAPKFPSGDNN